jgi:hypothetical protein
MSHGEAAMPVKIRKAGLGYRVTDKGRVTAKGTTKAKAQRQARLLRGVAHGWKPTGRRGRG